ncbi:YhcH/YjgK/YiaL family protein [Clostridium botulinum]|uniref:YhcH/YjgK/YiaL family protein n=1 Tax=Clostridium botulinum TaxID=1491 RepID=UPI000314B877|nr:YhcH/YjgK/YiaL family protein [Clostridium botulinum]KEI02953.1 EbgC protein [Clostridium botulinum D str. 16868]KLU76192.1 EbgC protein [Clostridium botulinum V891]KOA73048.1 EbgC protein [Clostridium botulinum]KOA94294.1 EbgC protein [Clostridium botulinum]KOC35359.1 EbgC protein [Clostridium botulinum]
MIIDNYRNAKTYCGINPNLDIALNYLINMDLNNLALGKNEIPDTDIFYIYQEYSSKPLKEGKWEGHRKYLDIQYIIDGCEKMGYCPINNLTPLKEYNPDTDFISFSGKSNNFFIVPQGNFAIFFPEDGHMPGLEVTESSSVKKLVFKVPIY